jgi:hypothetical protein
MTLEESEAEADRILSEAGWTTTLKPPWRGRHVAPGVVGGRAPDGNAYAKAYTAFAQSEAAAMGLDPALYPDEPHEAAAVLVASIAASVASAPEPEQIPAHETHGETGEEADGRKASPEALSELSDAGDAGSADLSHDGSGSRIGETEGDHAPDIIDADYLEANQLDDYSLGAEIEDAESEAAGAFIFGDNIHQMRTAATGLTVQAAMRRMPPEIDVKRYGELRNFAMGVSEGRWQQDAALAKELDELEANNSLRLAVDDVLKGKVEFLNGNEAKGIPPATREEIEAFDPEADWP